MNLRDVRRAYAEEICRAASVSSPALREAFATVPREEFLGPGPWYLRGPAPGQAGMTEDASPARVYVNASIAIDRDRDLFNGAPGLVASWIDSLDVHSGERVLHVGCGTGYYSALLASLVGPAGHVHAIEVDAELAARAERALAHATNVTIDRGDGRANLPEDIDVVLIHAGATHPCREWLACTRDNARVLVPLTVSMAGMSPTLSKGVVLRARRAGTDWTARVDSMIAIYSLLELRDETMNVALGRALMRAGSAAPVTRIRLDPHDGQATCWLHTPDCCVSAD